MLRNRFGRFFLRSVVCVLSSLPALVGVANAATADAEKSEKNAASRIVLLEFTTVGDANCERTEPLLSEMRRKNYPIRRVEKDATGAAFFDRFSIKTVPTFVLLVDGEELDRCVAQDESVAVLRNQLLRLFQRGREEVAERPKPTDFAGAKLSEKSDSKPPKKSEPNGGLIAKLTGANVPTSELVRGQISGENGSANLAALDESFGGFGDYSASADSNGTQAPKFAPKSTANGAPIAPIDAATVRISVGNASVGNGAIVHFNSTRGEALAVSSSALLSGSTGAGNDSAVSVVVADAATGRTATVSGLVVFCDVETDVALVAFNVPSGTNVRPAAFLPPNDSLQVGEIATTVVRATDDGSTRAIRRQILSLDRRSVAPKSNDPTRPAFSLIEVSNGSDSEPRGAGLFVERSGRLYFAGLGVSADAPNGVGLFLPLSVVAKSLQVRENLAVVYRDQLAGKFDVAAVDSGVATSDVAARSLDSFDSAATPKNVRPGRANADSRRIRSTNYEPKSGAENPVSNAVSNPVDRRANERFAEINPSDASNFAADSADAELFEASLDALRRRRLEGAEIICVVNWDDDPNSAAPRESEVLRLPKLGENAAVPPRPSGDSPEPRGVVRASSTFPETNLLR